MGVCRNRHALGRVELKSELFPKFKKLGASKVLCEEICRILGTFYKEEINLLFFNELPHIMIITYINVLRAALLYGIRPNEDRTLIISADRYRQDFESQFLKQRLYPHGLSTSVGQSHILTLGG